jgi:hypothetical protein
MKVKKLIQLLSKMDQERQVVISPDEMMRDCHLLTNVDDNARFSQYSGEVAFDHLTPELLRDGYTEKHLFSKDVGSKKVVVLW